MIAPTKTAFMPLYPLSISILATGLLLIGSLTGATSKLKEENVGRRLLAHDGRTCRCGSAKPEVLTAFDSLFCNVCNPRYSGKRDILKGSVALSCRACDWDMCMKCTTNRRSRSAGKGVIFIHGSTDNLSTTVRNRLAARGLGYHYLEFDWETFVNRRGGPPSPKNELETIVTALHKFVMQSRIDPSRWVVYMHSLGAHMGLVSLANGSKLRYSVTHDKYHKWKRVIIASGCLYACPTGGLSGGVGTGYPINEALNKAFPAGPGKSLTAILNIQTKFNQLSSEDKAKVTRVIGNIGNNVTRKAIPAFLKFRTAWLAGNMSVANSCFRALKQIPLQFQADEQKPLFNILKGDPQRVDRPTSPVSVVYAKHDDNSMNVFSFRMLLGLDTAASKPRSNQALEKLYKFGTLQLKRLLPHAEVQLISGGHLSLRGGQTELKEMLAIIQK